MIRSSVNLLYRLLIGGTEPQVKIAGVSGEQVSSRDFRQLLPILMLSGVLQEGILDCRESELHDFIQHVAGRVQRRICWSIGL
jgi:hypothetical protein